MRKIIYIHFFFNFGILHSTFFQLKLINDYSMLHLLLLLPCRNQFISIQNRNTLRKHIGIVICRILCSDSILFGYNLRKALNKV